MTLMLWRTTESDSQLKRVDFGMLSCREMDRRLQPLARMAMKAFLGSVDCIGFKFYWERSRRGRTLAGQGRGRFTIHFRWDSNILSLPSVSSSPMVDTPSAAATIQRLAEHHHSLVMDFYSHN